MARIRSIKPEFWSSEQIVECSPNARLLFIGLWNFCDDGGVHPASCARLKMEVFPADPFTKEQIGTMVRELSEAGLITEYEVDGEQYWQVTGWKHQKIDQPTYKHPRPQGGIPDSPPKRRTSDERSPNTSIVNGERSPLEGKGLGNGGEGIIQTTSGEKSPDLLGEKRQDAPSLKAVIFGPGLDWLAGKAEKPANSVRSLAGKWCRDYGDATVCEMLMSAQQTDAVDPIAWIERRLRKRGTIKGPPNGITPLTASG